MVLFINQLFKTEINKIIALFIILLMLASCPNNPLEQDLSSILTITAITIWRYGQITWHFYRAVVYKYRHFPKLRQIARSANQKNLNITLLIASYKTDLTNQQLFYQHLWRAVMRANDTHKVKIVLVTEPQNPYLANIKTIFNEKISFLWQHGQGKRYALAKGINHINQHHQHDLVMLLDADILIPENIITEVAPYFTSYPWLGAVTINNKVVTKGVFGNNWLGLRYAARNMMLCSQSYSKALLVLTGRCAIIRSTIVKDPKFANFILHHTIKHWFFGKIPMITGDDKSTNLFVLRKNYRSIYLPNIHITSLIEPLNINRSIILLHRWLGNMLRSRVDLARVAKLPLATRFMIFDQGVAMWISLILPMAIIATISQYNIGYIWFYLAWILISRSVYANLLLLFNNNKLNILSGVMMVYNHAISTCIKVYLCFFLPEQKGYNNSPVNHKLGFIQRLFSYTCLTITLVALYTITTSSIR